MKFIGSTAGIGTGTKYTRNDLELLKGYTQRTKGCYFMFNNVDMFEDAVAFKEMIRQGGDS